MAGGTLLSPASSGALAKVQRLVQRRGLIALLIGLLVYIAVHDLVVDGNLTRLGNNLVDGVSNGAILGGLIIGCIQQISDNRIGSEWTPVVVFGVLVLVMALRPQGLLGSETREAG